MRNHLGRKCLQPTSPTQIYFLFFLLHSCLRNQSKIEQCWGVLNKRTFRVCSGPSLTICGSFPGVATKPSHSCILVTFLFFGFHSSAPGILPRTSPIETHADRQSRESRVRKTSALHWKVPVPSRISSQLFRFGEMSFTQMACMRRKSQMREFKGERRVLFNQPENLHFIDLHRFHKIMPTKIISPGVRDVIS